MSGLTPAGAPLAPSEGASFFFINSGGAGVTTIVAPAANVNGVILRQCSVGISAGTTTVYGDTAAPTTSSDQTKRPLFTAGSTGSVPVVSAIPGPIRLAPGVGLYVAVSAAGQVVTGTYDIQ